MLPATTFLEREDLPLPFLSLFTKPFINMTEAVVEPSGEARQEWEVVEEIAGRIGIVPSSVMAARWLGRAGVKLSPRRLVELLMRVGPQGDRFGLRRGGLNMKRLAESPHGIVLAENLEEGVLARKVRHPGGRIQLCPDEIADEVERLVARDGDGLPLPAADDRPARAPLAQLLDAQLAEADGRRPRPPGADPPRRRGRGRGRGRRARPDQLRRGRDRDRRARSPTR